MEIKTTTTAVTIEPQTLSASDYGAPLVVYEHDGDDQTVKIRLGRGEESDSYWLSAIDLREVAAALVKMADILEANVKKT